MMLAKDILSSIRLYNFKFVNEVSDTFRRIYFTCRRTLEREWTVQKQFNSFMRTKMGRDSRQSSVADVSFEDKPGIGRLYPKIKSSCRRKPNRIFIKAVRSYHTGLEYVTKSSEPTKWVLHVLSKEEKVLRLNNCLSLLSRCNKASLLYQILRCE